MIVGFGSGNKKVDCARLDPSHSLVVTLLGTKTDAGRVRAFGQRLKRYPRAG